MITQMNCTVETALNFACGSTTSARDKLTIAQTLTMVVRVMRM